MKKLALLLLCSICLSIAHAQYYSQITKASKLLNSGAIACFEYDDYYYVLESGMHEFSEDTLRYWTVLNKYNRQGQELSSRVLKYPLHPRADVIIKNDTLYTVGYSTFEFEDSLQVSAIHLNSDYEKNMHIVHWIPARSYETISDTGEGLVVTSRYNMETDIRNFRTPHKPLIFFINYDLTLDTALNLDMPWTQVNKFFKLSNGHFITKLYKLTSKRLSNGVLGVDYFYGYLELDRNKKVIREVLKEIKDGNFNLQEEEMRFLVDDEGNKYFYCFRSGWFPPNSYPIESWDANDTIRWLHNSSYFHDRPKEASNAMKLAQNGDIINVGIAGRRYMLGSIYMERISPDGKTMWKRHYGYSKPPQNETSPWIFSKNMVPGGFIEDSHNNIFLVGNLRSSTPHATHPIFNDSTWLLRTDSLGCISDDKCNDEYWFDGPPYRFQYDQLNMNHKKWVYNVEDAQGNQSQVEMSFGLDTILGNFRSFQERYRPLIINNVSNGTTHIEERYSRWAADGRLLLDKKFDYLEEEIDSMVLYDFNLKVGDNFDLPLGFGQAQVTKVDSISLIQGYKRKRIVLQHIDPTNQAQFGDLVWIEGIGATNGILYYKDWIEGTKTELTCYYDRGHKKYSIFENGNCASSSIIIPFFNPIGALCLNSEPPSLPIKSEDSFQIEGNWTPDTIITNKVGFHKYIFTPNSNQNADTTSLWIEISAPINPEFNITGPFLVGSENITLPNISNNGVKGIWNPAVIETSMALTSEYSFLPNEDQCATPLYITIEVKNILDTTDMHPSTKWYTESFKSDLSDFNISSYVLNTIEVVKDTILDNRYCYVLGITSDRVYYAESELIVYTKNGKFFFHEDDEWRLLYDFTAMEDDTVTYYISKKYPYYSMGTVPMFENNESLLTLNPHQYVVKQSGTWVDEKGQPLRKYSAFWDFNEANHGFDLIVEKVGSLNHLFGNYISWTGEVIPPRVRCYTDGDVELNFVNEPCDKITSTKNLTQNIFSIYPNPASQVIHFEGVAGDAIIDIYNIHGQNVDSQKLLNNQIDISNLSEGFYILYITTQNKSEKHLMIKIE